jgi:hypothetical protein
MPSDLRGLPLAADAAGTPGFTCGATGTGIFYGRADTTHTHTHTHSERQTGFTCGVGAEIDRGSARPAAPPPDGVDDAPRRALLSMSGRAAVLESTASGCACPAAQKGSVAE